MRIFISWSGERSRGVALALHEWLPIMFRGVEPFVSSEDIGKGARWLNELDRQLEDAEFGVVCVTPENRHAPWIMYEAGALAKSVDHGAAAVLVIDLRKSDLEYPLARFQATSLERDDIALLVKAINARVAGGSYSEMQLQAAFDALWPRLEAALKLVIDGAATMDPEVVRSERELLEEIISTVRRVATVLESGNAPGGMIARSIDPTHSGAVPILKPAWIQTSEVVSPIRPSEDAAAPEN